MIQLITQAIVLANISVYLGYGAIVCFCVFGTLASMATFKDSGVVYWAFHYLPYVLIGLSMPISLYHLFILGRYRIIQKSILKIILMMGVGLLAFAFAMAIKGWAVAFYMSLFLAMVVWFGMPFLFRVNLKKFLDFLNHSPNRSDDGKSENKK
ncbi:hypothetical protein A9Z60_03050 [Moraxella nonliquefaciens]|uniref:Uncharacterized protein n=1 Tax=Moraxella nonliquefaciens TaxID=478 RepID=A0A1B8PJW1_MORNO|nr:hypothetical protein A9Z60_03050 [Moraxella nonliquefaciens]